MDYSLYTVRIFVSDWESALVFYTGKLQMKLLFRDDPGGWAQLDAGGATLALERVPEEDEEGRGLIGRFLGVSLEVPDLQAYYNTLRERGVSFVEEPEAMPWGGTLAHFRDPEGNVLTLLERRKES